MGWELWEFLCVEGLDKKTGVRDQGTGISKNKGKGPGLKPVSSRGWFQGPEGPCSLRKDNDPAHIA
jgi:hypothetical protein